MSGTLGDALRRLQGRVGRLEARLLVEHVTGCRHADLIARPETPLAPDHRRTLDQLLERREGGEPLAYLLGVAEFMGRPFRVSPAVLIPRPETAHLVELAEARLAGAPAPTVLDLGTGSGIVAISIALECPGAQVCAVDISAPALEVADANARTLGAVVDFRLGDWFAPVGATRFDLVVANPPYVAHGDPHLNDHGLPHEPRIALTDDVPGAGGLNCIRAIVAAAPAHLQPGGWLLFEHGYDQGARSRNLLTAAGFKKTFTQPDLAGIDRISGGQLI